MNKLDILVGSLLSVANNPYLSGLQKNEQIRLLCRYYTSDALNILDNIGQTSFSDADMRIRKAEMSKDFGLDLTPTGIWR